MSVTSMIGKQGVLAVKLGLSGVAGLTLAAAVMLAVSGVSSAQGGSIFQATLEEPDQKTAEVSTEFGRSMEAMAQAPDAESVLREREAALLARNVEGVVALFADDADVTTSSGRRFMNKEGIRGWVQEQADRSQREEVVGSRRMQGERLAWSARIYRADWQNLGVSPLDVTQEAIVEGGRIKLFITAFTPASAAKLDAARAAAQPGSASAAAPGPSALPRTGHSPGLAGTIATVAAVGVTLLLAGLALRRPRGYTNRTWLDRISRGAPDRECANSRPEHAWLVFVLVAIGVTLSGGIGGPAVGATQLGAVHARSDAPRLASSPLAAPTFSPWSPPVNLGRPLNSELEESAPMISRDGLSFYFNSPRPGGLGNEDIYVSRRAERDQPWGPPVNLGPRINTSFNDRIPTLSRDGTLLFFSSNRPGGLGGNDIWVARRAHTHDDFGWQEPVNAGAGVNSAANDEGPFYFANDDIPVPSLYFASNRPGGIGGFDIYVSQFTPDGSFGPALLVRELSSPENDARPNIRQDGLELFIHSNRVGSLGAADLWVSTRETPQSPWSNPVNLGATVNSAFNDRQPALSSDHQALFFSSERPAGLGGDDLYMTTRTKK